MNFRNNTLINRVTAVSGIALLLATPIAPFAVSHADSTSSYTTLSSFSGMPDALITVSGGNYMQNETVTVVASEGGTTIASATTKSSAHGEFSAQLQLPARLIQGAVTIIATGSTSKLTSSNSYYVTPFSPSLTASSSQTTPYSNLTVAGSGYAPNETIDLNLAGSVTTAQTDAKGAFSGAVLKTPDVKAASYTVIGAGEASGAKAVYYEYINGFFPSAAPSSYYVMPGASLGFTGSGYAPNETVTVSDSDTSAKISSFTTDATGAFTNAGSFAVPASYAGISKKFVLTGSTSNASTTASVTIGKYYPSVSPTSYYVMPGKTVSFNGSGFLPGETVDITSGTTKLGSVVADSMGNLIAAGTITIPTSAAGTNQTYALTGETTLGSGSVTVQVGNYNPQVSPSGYYVMPGSIVTFTGSGYAPSEVVTVFNGVTSLGSFKTDVTGNFTGAGNINVNYSQANSSVNYKLVGSVSQQPISFTIGVGQLNTQLTPSSYYVLPFSPFSVTASGFASKEVVTLMNGTTSVGTTTTDAFGAATFKNISLPYSALGSATLIATGSTSNATATVSIGMGNYFASVTADNYYAKPGSTIHLSGNGFAPNENVTIAQGSATQTVVADAKGNITASVVLALGQTKSSVDIIATGSLSHAASTTTITLAPYNVQVSPSTYYTQPGSPISFTGSGFLAGEPITVSLNGSLVGTDTADSKGNLTTTGSYTIPFATKAAEYILTGTKSGGSVTMDIGIAQFYAGLQLSSYYGNGGSMITATGSGFAPYDLIRIQSGTTTLAKTSADAKGNVSALIQVPYSAAGAITISAIGGKSGATASTSYTVAQVYNSVGLGSYAVPAGTSVHITGSGFIAGEPVTVTTDRTAGTYTFSAGSTGNLDDSGFVLPVSLSEGKLTLTITGTESYTTHQITFYVQSAQ